MTQVLEEPNPAEPWHCCLGLQCSELINSCPAPKAHLHHKPNICCATVVIKLITNKETSHTQFFITTAGSERSPKYSQATAKVTSASLWTNSNTRSLVFTSPHTFTFHISGNIFINHLHHFPTEGIFYYFRHLLPLAWLSTDRASLIELHSL